MADDGSTTGSNSEISSMILRVKLDIWDGQVSTILRWLNARILVVHGVGIRVSGLGMIRSLRTYGSIVLVVVLKLRSILSAPRRLFT